MPDPTPPRRTIMGSVPPDRTPPTAVMPGRHLEAPPSGPPPVPTPPPPLAPERHDPLSKLLDLPSRGLYYPGNTATARVRPSRGEDELGVSGTAPGSIERIKATRDLVARCVTMALPFEELLVDDYSFLATHFSALTLGTDEINLKPGCDKPQCPLAVVTMTTLPCTYLHLVDGVEPPLPEAEVDPMLRAAQAVEQREAEAAQAQTSSRIYRRITREEAKEPFETKLKDGQVVKWRYLRVKDLMAAEDFALESGSALNTSVEAATGAFLSARSIISINGRTGGTVGAMQWWAKMSSPLLLELRRAMRRKRFGYDAEPEFTCSRGDCRKKVKVALDPEGMFRVERP